jgi:hypothetical protein
MEEFHSKHGILNEERHAKQLIGQWGTSQGILRLTALDAECADCAGPELDLCVVRRLPKLPSEIIQALFLGDARSVEHVIRLSSDTRNWSPGDTKN